MLHAANVHLLQLHTMLSIYIPIHMLHVLADVTVSSYMFSI